MKQAALAASEGLRELARVREAAGASQALQADAITEVGKRASPSASLLPPWMWRRRHMLRRSEHGVRDEQIKLAAASHSFMRSWMAPTNG